MNRKMTASPQVKFTANQRRCKKELLKRFSRWKGGIGESQYSEHEFMLLPIKGMDQQATFDYIKEMYNMQMDTVRGLPKHICRSCYYYGMGLGMYIQPNGGVRISVHDSNINDYARSKGLLATVDQVSDFIAASMVASV